MAQPLECVDAAGISAPPTGHRATEDSVFPVAKTDEL
jgi:hypothetical protein